MSMDVPKKALGDKSPLKRGRKKGARSPVAKTGKTTLNITLRQAQAFQLRVQGFNLAEIGRALSPPISAAAVHKLIERGLDEVREANTGDLVRIRELEIARLDELHRALWSYAVPSTGVPDDKAVDRVLKIAERRAKLLGLDAPTKLASTDPIGNPLPPAPTPTEPTKKDDTIRDLVDTVRELLHAGGKGAASAPPA